MNQFIGTEPTIFLSGLGWVLAAVAAAAMFILTRQRPDYGLAVLIAALPFYQVRGTLGIPTTLLEILLLAWLAAVATRWPAYRPARTSYDVWLGIWVTGGLVAALLGPDLREGLGLWRAFFFEPALFFFGAAAVVRRHDARAVLAGAIGLVTVLAVWTGIRIVSGAEISYDLRLLGPFQSANFLAMLLVPAVLLVALWPGREWRSARIVAFVTGSAMVVASQSRGGYLAFLAGAAVAVLYLARHWSRRTVAGLLLLAVITAALVGWKLFDRPAPLAPVRAILWEQSADMIRENPVLGAHPGQFQDRLAEEFKADQFYTRYVVPFAPNPHNLWLVTWVEWGLLALFGLVGLLVAFARTIWRTRGRWVLVPTAMMAAILTHGIVDVPVLKNDLAILFMLTLVLTTVPLTAARRRRRR